MTGRGWVAVLPMALLLAGCGSGSASKAPSSPSPGPAPVSPSASLVPSALPTSTAAVSPPVPDAGAQSTFTPPGAPSARPYSLDCRTVLDTGYNGSCVFLTSPHGQVVGLVETQQSQERALVYQRSGDQWLLTLRSTATVTSDYSGRRVAQSDLENDGDPKFVFSTPQRGAGSALAEVDVVEAPGQVVLHQDLTAGVATKADQGGLETWSQQGGGLYRHRVTAYLQGEWRTVVDNVVPATAVPQISKVSSTF